MKIGPEPRAFTPVWLADLGPDHPALGLLRPRDEHASTVSLRRKPAVWAAKVQELAAKVGTLDVLAIGATQADAANALAPARESFGRIRALRDVVPWPLQRDRSTSRAPAGPLAMARSLLQSLRKEVNSLEEAERESASEHRLATMMALLFEFKASPGQTFDLASLFGGTFCIDRITQGSARGGSYRPLFTKHLEPESLANTELLRELFAESAVRRILKQSACYVCALPTDTNLDLPMSWPGNCLGARFGVFDGMAALWLLHEGAW